MKDKSWLLNASAIAAAKKCIVAIERELGIKLKLSHPQFLDMVDAYSELTESVEIKQFKEELYAFANVPVVVESTKNKVISFSRRRKALKRGYGSVCDSDNMEMITVRGRAFPRFDEKGNEFKGLYRGQARYA